MPDDRTRRGYGAALSEALSRAAYAFDRLHAHMFDAPWACGRSPRRTF